MRSSWMMKQAFKTKLTLVTVKNTLTDEHRFMYTIKARLRKPAHHGQPIATQPTDVDNTKTQQDFRVSNHKQLNLHI